MTIRCRSRRRTTVDWQRCVGLFLEGLSLFGELHGTHVIKGRVEPLVVVPPDVPVDVRAQLFHARVGLATMYKVLDSPMPRSDRRDLGPDVPAPLDASAEQARDGQTTAL